MQQRRAWSILGGGFITEDKDADEIVHECFLDSLCQEHVCTHHLTWAKLMNYSTKWTTFFHSSPGPYPGSRGSLQPFASGFSGGSCFQLHPILTWKPESISPSMPGTPPEDLPQMPFPYSAYGTGCIKMPAKAFCQMAPRFLLALFSFIYLFFWLRSNRPITSIRPATLTFQRHIVFLFVFFLNFILLC